VEEPLKLLVQKLAYRRYA